METQSGTKLERVEALLSATLAAPSFGLNSRELVLRAARQACSDEEEDLPPRRAQSSSTTPVVPSTTPLTGQADTGQAPSGLLVERLVQEGLTVHERPIVQYVPRTGIPRVARQGVANRLAGQQLAALLQQAGIDVSVEGVQQPQAAAARKAAVIAALAQELDIFRKASSKQVYMNLAARTSASPEYLRTEALPKDTSEGAGDRAEAPATDDAKIVPDGDDSTSCRAPGKRKNSHDSSDAPMEKRGRAQGDMEKQETPAPLLQTADIDWKAGSDADSDGSDQRETAAVSPHAEHREFEVGLGEEELRQATLHFVKAILNPLYHSQVLDKDMYKKVLQKVVDKIVQTHSGAADASFLIEEASRIQKLVQDYIHHLRD